MSGELHKDIKIDAYEACAWNGIVFVVKDAAAFEVRISSLLQGNLIGSDSGINFAEDMSGSTKLSNGAKLVNAVNKVGPHAPDGSYCEIGWNPAYPAEMGQQIILQWSKVREDMMLGKVTYDCPSNPANYWTGNPPCDVIFEVYSPWKFSGNFRVRDGLIEGESSFYPSLHEIEWSEWKFLHTSNEPNVNRDHEPGLKGGYFKHTYDDKDWSLIRAGTYWQECPGVENNGYSWYRNDFVIPRRYKGCTLEVDLGKISTEDWTYFNGNLIGNTRGKDKRRIYRVHTSDPGYEDINWDKKNVIAVQVRNYEGLGGISSGEVRETMRDYSARPRIRINSSKKETWYFYLICSKTPDHIGRYQHLSKFQDDLSLNGKLNKNEEKECAALQFCNLHVESKYKQRDNILFFVAGVGKERTSLLNRCKDILRDGNRGMIIEKKKEKYNENRVKIVGSFKKSAEIITNNLHWTALYSPEQKRDFIVDSRSWFLPESWGLFANSGIMCALAASVENKRLAFNTLKGVFAEQLSDGRIMNAAGNVATTPDRSEDMYAAYCTWKVYKKFKDVEMLKWLYPRLKKWHFWWFANRGDGQPRRDGNKDGFLEIGSDIVAPTTPQDPETSDRYWKYAQCAFWEGGYDDSPMWGSFQHPPEDAEAKYIYRTNTINLNLVCRNTLYALNAEFLAMIAKELGFDDDYNYFRKDYEKMKEKINEYFWDDNTGMYLNRFWKEYGGKFSHRKSPTTFFALAAGIPSRNQAMRLVHEHLLNESEFWGDYVLPTISRDDPAFSGQYYWRGVIWPPMNYFTYEGLKRYGFDEIAAELAKKSYHMILREWDRQNYLWENYNSITGEGDPKGRGNSTKHYSWSACFALMPIMEFLDEEAWAGLRFGSIGIDDESTIKNVELGGYTYDVTIGKEGTRILRDKVEIFNASTAIVVRNFQSDGRNINFDVKTKNGISDYSLKLGGLVGNKEVNVMLDNKHYKTIKKVDDKLSIVLPAGEYHLMFICAK